MNRPLLSVLAVLLAATGACAQSPQPSPAFEAGFEPIAVAHPERPLRGALWTPVEPGTGERIEAVRGPAFLGVPARKGGLPAAGRRPVVVLSHGFGGHFANQAWLAARLAQAGYVVAAISHPGTSFDDRDPARGRALAERPRDLTRLLDALAAKPELTGRIDLDRVAAIGHSLGGWTAMAIVGARFDPDRFEADCRAGHDDLASCKVYARLGVAADAPARAALGADLRDPRVKAVVSLDLGLSRGLTPESLGRIEAPLLILAAGAPMQALPSELESQDLARRTPPAGTSFAAIAGATHFSFMGLCAPGAREMIEKEEPGEGMVCDDAGRPRAESHAEVAERVLSFLATALPR